MRTAYKVWSGIAAGVFCLVAAADLTGTASRLVTVSAGAPTASGPAGSPVVTVDVSAAHPGSGSVVTGPVTKVVDGATLEVAGQPVRVLGIDVCAVGTPAGDRAKARAVSLLADRTVALRSEPGVDRDSSGRELRYVSLDGRDFGLGMVGHDDAGVARGHSDAAPAYLAQLRAADTDGIHCGTARRAR